MLRAVYQRSWACEAPICCCGAQLLGVCRTHEDVAAAPAHLPAEFQRLSYPVAIAAQAEQPVSVARSNPSTRSQGKWFRGIADELRRGPDGGAVALVEHKTRRRPSTPGALQQDTARLQLMLYRALLAGLRRMPAAQASPASVSFADRRPERCQIEAEMVHKCPPHQ